MKRRAMSADGTVKHVRLHRWLLQTEAWRLLSLGGRSALIELYDLYNGDNNGTLFLSARDLGRRLNVRKDTAAGYLWDCEAHGFIRPRQRGSFSWKARHATTWILTEYGYGGALPTKDFMRWTPGTALADRDRPGSRAKFASRARKAGQVVTKNGTVTGTDGAICHAGRDRLSKIGASLGHGKRDTDSLPAGGVRERVASAARQRAGEGERESGAGNRTDGKPPATLECAPESIRGPLNGGKEKIDSAAGPTRWTNPGASDAAGGVLS